MTDTILDYITTYGPVVILISLWIKAMGIPLPGTVIVIASGAFIRQGVLDVYWTISLALVGTILGDSLSYGMGRFARQHIPNRYSQSPAWHKAKLTLAKRGGLAVYFTRWIFTPLAVPINLVAASGGYPFRKFILYDIAGKITWFIIFGGLGYIFGGQWEAVSNFTGNINVAIGIIIFFGIIYWLMRRSKLKLAGFGTTFPRLGRQLNRMMRSK